MCLLVFTYQMLAYLSCSIQAVFILFLLCAADADYRHVLL
jgi:hypothetical protein